MDDEQADVRADVRQIAKGLDGPQNGRAIVHPSRLMDTRKRIEDDFIVAFRALSDQHQCDLVPQILLVGGVLPQAGFVARAR
jgi:hypothetical protein